MYNLRSATNREQKLGETRECTQLTSSFCLTSKLMSKTACSNLIVAAVEMDVFRSETDHFLDTEPKMRCPFSRLVKIQCFSPEEQLKRLKKPTFIREETGGD